MLSGNRLDPRNGILVGVPDETPPIPVITVDSHDVARAGIAHWAGDAALDVRASFKSPQQYLDWTTASARSRAVVIIDPEGGDTAFDFESLREVIALGEPAVVYSRTMLPEIVLRCLDHGAACYLAKSEPRETLLNAVNDAWHGRRPVSATVQHAESVAARHGRPQLSAQELRVLLTWIRGVPKRDVAERHHIALSTVRTHLQRVRCRYEAAGRPAPDKAALLARAIQDGFVGIDEL